MRWLKTLAVGALAASLVACTTSPTGRTQFTMMPDDELNQLGAQSFAQYQQELPTVGGATQAYVQCVTNAIVAALPPGSPQYDWQVRVFRDDSANAFALPGGYVGVHTGLLDIADNQDQLASVIGHEIGHVLARHANERMSTQNITSIGLSVASSAAGLQGAQAEMANAALGMGAQYGILLPFSRSHESEADVIGLRLMADAGFNPQGSVDLWRNMRASGGGGEPPEWMSTHPSSGQRIANLESEMNKVMPNYQRARQAGRQPNCRR
jgi:predicted Zn-dependent protease